MKYIQLISILFVICCQSSLLKAAVNLSVQEHMLSNGLKILFVEQEESPVVSFALYYRVGSIDETPGKTGIAHYCEHMMFKSTENLGGESFARLLGAVGGGHSNANTSFDRTCYHETVPVDRLELVIRLEAERMANLQPTREEAGKELEVVQEELRLNYLDDPNGRLRFELFRNAFDIHPYKIIPIGKLDDVQSITYEDLMNFQRKYYVPNNAVAIIVGHFNKAETLKMMEMFFGVIPKGNDIYREFPVEPVQTTERRFTLDLPVQRSMLMMGYKVPSASHPDNLAVRVLSTALSHGGSSPLGQLSQGADPVSMYAYAYCRSSLDPGLMVIGGMPLPGKSPQILENRINEEIKKIIKNGITQDKLGTAKAQIRAQNIYAMQSSMGIAFNLGEAEMVGSWKDALQLENRLDEITPEKIQSVAQQYLKPQNRTIGTIASEKPIGKPMDTQTNKEDKNQTVTMSIEEYLEKANWDQDSTIQFPDAKEYVMDNGLRVLVVERHDLPMVYARAQIRGGSIYDPDGKAGLAYLTGWVLTEGTKSYPDETIDTIMDRNGAYVTSVAFNESCISTLTCLSEDIQDLFPYYAEILSNAAFEESNFEEGRQYVIGDLMQSSDDANDLCYRRFREDVFKNHPYAKPRKGTIEGLRSISREDVLGFYRTYYTPDRSVLVLVGDISPEIAKQLCSQYLSDWKPSTKPLPSMPKHEQQNGLQIFVVDKDTSQAQVNIGHIGINRVNPDRFKIQVMNRILGGGGLYTRLATEVRVKRGLTYGIYSFFAKREFTGEFAVSTFTKVDTLGETVRVILAELKKIRENPVSDEELMDAKQGLIGSFPLQFEKYEGIAQDLVHMSFYKLPREDIIKYPQYINSVTKTQIMETAQKYIHPNDLVITIVGPADRIVPQIENLGTVKVVPEI